MIESGVVSPTLREIRVLTLRTVTELAAELSRGGVTSRKLTDAALSSIALDGSAFTRVYEVEARAAADESDRARAGGVVPSPLAGIPVSIKDLFDVAGEPTPAGSTILRDAEPARRDAPVVARLRAAGAVIVGRTHMSEFAFSGLGTNPHLPHCANPRDPERVPGGSSSGATVSVARGQAVMGLGSDTGGSVRIPAAFCGLTGFKPTQRRITRDGAFPLSETQDSIGPIANSVECCRIADAILSDVPVVPHSPLALAGLRFGVPTDVVLNDLDDAVSMAFDRALGTLSHQGATVERISFPEFARVAEMNARGTISNWESFRYHSRMGLLRRRDEYDPNVQMRVAIGEGMTTEDYARLLEARAVLIHDADRRSRGYDALVFPAVGCVAPRCADVVETAGWTRANAMALRNASLVNLLDRCALSLPMHHDGELPSGLMIVGETMADARVLAISEAVERALTGQ